MLLKGLAALCASALIATVTGLASAVIGRQALKTLESWRLRQIATERLRAAGRHRLVMGIGEAGNAAVWYRRSFEAMAPVSVEQAQLLAAASTGRFKNDALSRNVIALNLCAAAPQDRLREGLHRTGLDWQLYAVKTDGSQADRKSLVLGSCLIVEGHVDRARGRFTDAQMRYFEALSFGCDLGQREMATTLVGMSVSRAALVGLAQLLPVADQRQLSDISSALLRFEGHLPTIGPAIRFALLEAAANLEAEGNSVFRARKVTIRSYLVPSGLVVAWRLRREEPVLALMADIADSTDQDAIERRAADLDRSLATTTDPGLRAAVPSDCNGPAKSGRYLRAFFHAVEAAVALWQSRGDRGQFPVDADFVKSALARDGLRYVVAQDRQQFRIETSPDAGSVVLLQQAAR